MQKMLQKSLKSIFSIIGTSNDGSGNRNTMPWGNGFKDKLNKTFLHFLYIFMPYLIISLKVEHGKRTAKL